jgi:hypothetical protein
VLEVVPPVTVAVRVVDWPMIMVLPTDDITLTLTALVALLLPPQPANQRQGIATPSATQFQMLLDFITLASPT